MKLNQKVSYSIITIDYTSLIPFYLFIFIVRQQDAEEFSIKGETGALYNWNSHTTFS
jgi:hypothetical protein